MSVLLGASGLGLAAEPFDLRLRGGEAPLELFRLLPGFMLCGFGGLLHRLGLAACDLGCLLRRLELFPKRGRAPLVLPRRRLGLVPEALDFRLRGGEALFALSRRCFGLASSGLGRLPRLLDLTAKGDDQPLLLPPASPRTFPASDGARPLLAGRLPHAVGVRPWRAARSSSSRCSASRARALSSSRHRESFSRCSASQRSRASSRGRVRSPSTSSRRAASSASNRSSSSRRARRDSSCLARERDRASCRSRSARTAPSSAARRSRGSASAERDSSSARRLRTTSCHRPRSAQGLRAPWPRDLRPRSPPG